MLPEIPRGPNTITSVTSLSKENHGQSEIIFMNNINYYFVLVHVIVGGPGAT